MAYCPKCNAEVIFGFIGRNLREETEEKKKIREKYAKEGKKVIFTDWIIDSDSCPECNAPLEDVNEEDEEVE